MHRSDWEKNTAATTSAPMEPARARGGASRMAGRGAVDTGQVRAIQGASRIALAHRKSDSIRITRAAATASITRTKTGRQASRDPGRTSVQKLAAVAAQAAPHGTQLR